MTSSRKDPCDDDDREKRIAEMKRQLAEMSGATMAAWESDALSDADRETFWRHVMAHECGPFTTDFEGLLKAGVELPQPESLNAARRG